MIENIRELVAFIADNRFTIKIERYVSKPFGWVQEKHELVIEAYSDFDVRTKNKTTGSVDLWDVESFKCYLERRKWSLTPEDDTARLFPDVRKKEEKKLSFIEFSDKLKEWHDNFKLIEFEENGRIDTFEIQWWGRGAVSVSQLFRGTYSWGVSVNTAMRCSRNLYDSYKKGEFKFLNDTFETYKKKMEQENKGE